MAADDFGGNDGASAGGSGGGAELMCFVFDRARSVPSDTLAHGNEVLPPPKHTRTPTHTHAHTHALHPVPSEPEHK